MFSNQLSARELFNNGSQSQSTQDRMMPSDFSQIQNAQMTQLEYSMANSQDFFSQDQYSSGSGVGYVSNRPSAIDKYIAKQAKPSLFRTNSQNKITVGRPPSTISGPGMERKSHVPPSNYMETLNMMKTKTKEREERDMLSSIVSIVQECSDEVKSNLSSMKINDKDHCETLKSSFASLTHSLDESSKKILTAVKQKHDIDSEIAVLRKELRQKDEKIYQLQQKQTNKDDSVDNSSTLLDSLKSFLVEQQTKTSHSLQKVLEHTQEQLKQIKEFTSDHRNGLEENNKHIKDLKYSSAGHVQDIEKRLVNELVSLRDDFDHQKRDMENFLRSHINSNQQKHNRDLEKHIQKACLHAGVKMVRIINGHCRVNTGSSNSIYILDPCNCTTYYKLISTPILTKERISCDSGQLWNQEIDQCQPREYVLKSKLCNERIPWNRCFDLTDSDRIKIESQCIQDGFFQPSTGDSYFVNNIHHHLLTRESQLANLELMFAALIAGCVITVMMIALLMTFCDSKYFRNVKFLSKLVQPKSATTSASHNITEGDNVSVVYEDVDENEEDALNTGYKPMSTSSAIWQSSSSRTSPEAQQTWSETKPPIARPRRPMVPPPSSSSKPAALHVQVTTHNITKQKLQQTGSANYIHPH